MSATKSMGTTLTKIKSGSESVDLLIANLTKIGEFGVESEEIDATTLDSADGFKEFIAGLKDAGEVALTGLVKDETNMTALLALALSQSVEEWKVTFVSGSKWEFSAFVKMFKEGESTVEGLRNFTMSVRISGAPTYTSAEVSA